MFTFSLFVQAYFVLKIKKQKVSVYQIGISEYHNFIRLGPSLVLDLHKDTAPKVASYEQMYLFWEDYSAMHLV